MGSSVSSSGAGGEVIDLKTVDRVFITIEILFDHLRTDEEAQGERRAHLEPSSNARPLRQKSASKIINAFLARAVGAASRATSSS